LASICACTLRSASTARLTLSLEPLAVLSVFLLGDEDCDEDFAALLAGALFTGALLAAAPFVAAGLPVDVAAAGLVVALPAAPAFVAVLPVELGSLAAVLPAAVLREAVFWVAIALFRSKAVAIDHKSATVADR
jgi:hypothetical protein